MRPKEKLSPNTKEIQALEDFKFRIRDLIRPHHDDHFFHKWLKARNYDVDKAEKMFKESMAYRQKIGADKLVADYKPPEVLQKYMPGGSCGYDKEGSPVRVDPYGSIDMKGLMYSCKKSDLEKTKFLQNELITRDCAERTKKTGERVDGLTVICDMNGVSSKHFWRPGLRVYLELVKILEDNYPELMKRTFIINAPRIFPFLWKICRPLISEDTRNKIRVLGSDYEKVLLEYIDADSIPKYLGGSLTDPDGNPRCNTMICHGGVVPEQYFMSRGDDTEGMEKVSLTKGERLKFDFDVEYPGSIIRWEFRTEDYDIGFGVLYISNGEKQELVPVKRYNSHQLVQDGTIECEKVGTYAIVFDNHYSWSRGKTLYYLIELHSSDDVTDSEVDMVSGGSWTRLIQGILVTHL